MTIILCGRKKKGKMMKMYCVIMENVIPVPLSPQSDSSAGLKVKEFDTEQEAVDFAKSVRNNCGHVYIKNTKTDEQIGEFFREDQ